MKEPENIEVVCLTCSLTFVTSRDSYDDGESSCPACGERLVSERQ